MCIGRPERKSVLLISNSLLGIPKCRFLICLKCPGACRSKYRTVISESRSQVKGTYVSNFSNITLVFHQSALCVGDPFYSSDDLFSMKEALALRYRFAVTLLFYA